MFHHIPSFNTDTAQRARRPDTIRNWLHELVYKLILSPGAKGTAGAIELKQDLLRKDPDRYLDLDQFRDPANIMAHYQTMGREIFEQTGGVLDTVVVGIGTAGTGVGISLRLMEYNSEIRIIGVTPELGFALQGLRNPMEHYPTQLFRKEKFDEIIELPREDMAAIKETALKGCERRGAPAWHQLSCHTSRSAPESTQVGLRKNDRRRPPRFGLEVSQHRPL